MVDVVGEGGRLRRAKAWVVRAGEHGENIAHNLRFSVVTYKWDQIADLNSYISIEELKEDIDLVAPELQGNRRSIGAHAGQLWRFRHEIDQGDIVVLPLKGREGNRFLAIGRVEGPYEFDAGQEEGALHRIPVEWLADHVDKLEIDSDLVASVQSQGTVIRIRAADAFERLLHIADPEADLRGVRQDPLHRTDALSGDEAGVQVSEGQAMPEGAITHAEVLRYERSDSARAACLQHFGFRCQVCNLDFEERYGELGRGFMHVHHIVPLHEVAGIPSYRVNPIKDLRPVCPNCHAMLHRPEDRVLTVEELRELLLPERPNDG